MILVMISYPVYLRTRQHVIVLSVFHDALPVFATTKLQAQGIFKMLGSSCKMPAFGRLLSMSLSGCMHPSSFAGQTVGLAPSSFDHPLHSKSFMTDINGNIASMQQECLQEMVPQPAIRSPRNQTLQEEHLTKLCENVISARIQVLPMRVKMDLLCVQKAVQVSSVHGMRTGKRHHSKSTDHLQQAKQSYFQSRDHVQDICSVEERYLSIEVDVQYLKMCRQEKSNILLYLEQDVPAAPSVIYNAMRLYNSGAKCSHSWPQLAPVKNE